MSKPIERFIVNHYVGDERPSIKGNGFDGLAVGETREEAEEFVAWLNEHLSSKSAAPAEPDTIWVELCQRLFKLLDDLVRSTDGVNKESRGYQQACGWNEALQRVGDCVRGGSITPPAAIPEAPKCLCAVNRDPCPVHDASPVHVSEAPSRVLYGDEPIDDQSYTPLHVSEAPAQTEAAEQIEHLDAENHALRQQVKALTREAWTWNQALTTSISAMQKLMARLATLLDEDQFAECESIVKQAGVPTPTEAPAQTEAIRQELQSMLNDLAARGAPATANLIARTVEQLVAALATPTPEPAQTEGWHAPGIGEVHNRDHSSMIYCSKSDGDFEIADDVLAKRVCAALKSENPSHSDTPPCANCTDEQQCEAYNRGIKSAQRALASHSDTNQPSDADIAFLVEAYRYGQFADDMFDHPSPSVRSPAKPVREALRRVLSAWDAARLPGDGDKGAA